MDKLLLEEVIDRYKHPRHRGRITAAKEFRAQNLSCGDVITLYLEIDNNVVKSAKFDGELCSIANYGAELLLDRIIGQPITAVTSRELLGDFDGGLLNNPVRLKCFELPQVALNESKGGKL